MSRILLLVFLALFLIVVSFRNWKMLIAAVIAATAATLFFLYGTVHQLGEEQTGDDAPVSVRILYENDKKDIFLDPEFRELLKRRHGIIVIGEKGDTADVSAEGLTELDGLWPDGYLAAQRLAKRFTETEFGEADTFYTIPAFYSWPEITAVLKQEGVVKETETGGWVMTDLPRLLDLVAEQRTWSSLGLRQQEGAVSLHLPDPAVSGTGLVGLGLLGTAWNDGHSLSPDRMAALLPRLKDLYGKLAITELSGETLFSRYIKQGVWAFPLILAEEKRMIALYQRFPVYQEKIQEDVRVLYPEPTIRIPHPFLWCTPNGERLAKALLSPEIQALLWARYGFRSTEEASPSLPGLRIPEQPDMLPPPPVPVLKELRNAVAAEQ